MIITREDGSQELIKILFFFHNDERGKDYYFLYTEDNPDEVICMSSADGQSLEELDDEEFDEANQVFEAYMEDPVLSKRLIEISEALLELDSDDPTEVMGYPDDLKLRSSMTLFSMVSDNPVFQKVLDKFYGGEECSYTREYLR